MSHLEIGAIDWGSLGRGFKTTCTMQCQASNMAPSKHNPLDSNCIVTAVGHCIVTHTLTNKQINIEKPNKQINIEKLQHSCDELEQGEIFAECSGNWEHGKFTSRPRTMAQDLSSQMLMVQNAGAQKKIK